MKDINKALAILADKGIDPDEREKAIKTLGINKCQEAIPLLIDAAFNDTDLGVRCWAITAMGDIGDKSVTDKLLNLLLNNGEELRVRLHAAHALGKIGDDAAILPLLKVFRVTKDSSIKDIIALALFHLDEDQVALPLFKYLKYRPEIQEKFKLFSSSD